MDSWCSASPLPPGATAPRAGPVHVPSARLGRTVLVLGTACTLAGLAVAATILLQRAGNERQAMEAQALALARSTAFAAEREVATTFARLEGLSVAPALRTGDIPALYAQLVQTPAPPGSWFVVADASGHLLNTLLPLGDPRLPRTTGDRAPGMITARIILDEGKRTVGGVLWAPIAKIHTVAIGMPVALGPDGRRGALMASVPQHRMLALLQEQPLPPQWRATLVDQFSNVVARIEPKAVLGSPDPPQGWARQLRGGSREALFEEKDSAGTPMLVAIAPAQAVGWTAAVEIPLAVLDAPWREALERIVLSAGALLVLALLGAGWLKTRIDHSVGTLAQAADVAEERQREIAARFRHYWNSTPDGLFMLRVTPEQDVVFEGANPTYERVAGLQMAGAAGKRPEECLSAGAAALMRRGLRQCVDSGTAVRFFERHEQPDGQREWETTLSPMHDADTGRVTVLFGTTRDVTERLRAEEAIRLSEERLRLAQRAAGAVVWDCDIATGQVHWSAEMSDLLGIAPGADERTDLQAFLCALVHPEDRRHVEARLRSAMTRGGQFEAEFRYMRGGGGGELRWMAARGGVVTTGRPDQASGSGEAERRLLGVTVDVTARRRAELAARESLALVQGSLDALVARVAILDGERRIVAVNEAWCRGDAMTWSVAANPLGSDYLAVCNTTRWPAPEAANLEAGLHAVAQGAVDEYRQEYAWADAAKGRDRWFQVRITRFGRGQGLRLVVAHEDVTEVRRSAEALKAMTGRLLTLQDEERRRIARELHDSTLQDLAMAAIGLDLSLTRGEARRESLEDARALLKKAMRDVRTLSYILHPPLLDVFGLKAALAAYAEGFSRRSEVECELSLDDTPPASIPPVVAVTLFRVAQEAFANVHRHSGAKLVRVFLRLTEGESVELRIEDDGRGFGDNRTQELKDVAHALGVGIPGMRARIRQLKGDLSIETGSGGTAVIADVPLIQKTTEISDQGLLEHSSAVT